MCLKPTPTGPVPSDTVRVAKVAFPNGNCYMRLRDELGVIYNDEDFADLFPRRGQPAYAPWRLALVTVMPSLSLRGKLSVSITRAKS